MDRKINDAEFIGICNQHRKFIKDIPDGEQTDLTGLDLSEIKDHTWSQVHLCGIDLSKAEGLPKAPVISHLDRKILHRVESGLFDMDAFDDIIWSDGICKTTHCRAGWAYTLAGNEGLKLKERFGSEAAGALIYAATYPGEPTPDFYCSDEEAIEDMKRHA